VNRHRPLTALAFLAPNIGGFAVFTLIPVVAAFALSLCDWDLFRAPTFVGLRNFRDLLGWHLDGDSFAWNDPLFWKYLGNTLFIMTAIPVTMAASLFLALLLNRPFRGRYLFRTIYFVPTICAGVGLLLLWENLFDAEFGLINQTLSLIGIDGPRWLLDYNWAKPALMIMKVWGEMGGLSMIIYLAGLQGIPQELYEAAQIDGASARGRFRHITWPMLAPTTFFVFITSIINGFQTGFNMAYVMTRGGPAGATTTVDYYIYLHGFRFFNMGYAAAIAVVLFAIIFTVTMVNWRFGGRVVSYG